MGRGLQTLNEQNKLTLWAGRITECRNSGRSVKAWCQENGICEQTYYKWQRRLFQMAQEQQELQFAEITPKVQAAPAGIAVTIRAVGVEADIHNGADPAVLEAVLRAFKPC